MSGYGTAAGILGQASGLTPKPDFSSLQLQAAQELSPKRVPELQVVSANLTERIAVLSKELSGLEQRLEAILRPQPPQTQTSMATPDYCASTQLGQLIAQATGNVDVCINRVRGMLDLLEL